MLDRLIAESEAAIARGYRVERELRVRPALRLCGAGPYAYTCFGTEPYAVRRPVAVLRPPSWP